MIDVQDLLRRLLVQLVLTLAFSLVIFTFPPPETTLAIKIILILGSLALLIGLMPGSYLWKVIHRVSAKAQSGSTWLFLILAIFTPLFFIYLSGSGVLQNYGMITSNLPDGLKEQLKLQQSLILDLSECLLQFSILLSHSIFLLRSWRRSKQAGR